MEQYNKAVKALQNPELRKRLSNDEFLTSIEDVLKTHQKSDLDINTPESRKAAKKLRKEIRRKRLALLKE